MRRLGLSLLIVVVISVIAAGWAIDRLFIQLDRPDQTLLAAETLGYQLATLIDTGQQELADVPESMSASGFSLSVMARDAMTFPHALEQELASGQALTLESDQGIALYFSLPDTGRVLSIGLPEPSDKDTQLRLLLTVLFYAAIATLILLWLYPLVRRLQQLAFAARRFGEGHLTQRIETHPRSQLHDIESEFNGMARRIEALLEDNKLLSGAVSHDLKTPLARLRFGVDALMEQPAGTRQADYLERISQDLSMMEDLVQVLLEFAGLDQRLSELPLKSTLLQAQVETSIQQFTASQACHIESDLNCPQARIMAEPRYLSMLLNNILQNATKFAHRRVRVSLTSKADKLHLQIDDDGPGFVGENVERLIKPFEKGAAKLTAGQPKGHGLGLAIVKRICDSHKAALRLGQSKVLGGASISVEWVIVRRRQAESA